MCNVVTFILHVEIYYGNTLKAFKIMHAASSLHTSNKAMFVFIMLAVSTVDCEMYLMFISIDSDSTIYMQYI